mgnify:CR=1 FL=1|tara:strand:- start:591 stop:1064 length:474 start_codon:yes stop_codon:yes gene_type:complete
MTKIKSDLDGLAAREADEVTNNARAKDPRFIECLKRIGMGQSIRGACGSSKMPRKILYQWMEEDSEIKELVEEAKDIGMGSIETRFMMGSDNDNPTDWRAMSWMLARRFPDAYGEKKELTVSTNEGAQKQLEMVSAMIEQTSEIMTDDDDTGRESEE